MLKKIANFTWEWLGEEKTFNWPSILIFSIAVFLVEYMFDNKGFLSFQCFVPFLIAITAGVMEYVRVREIDKKLEFNKVAKEIKIA